MRPQTHLRQPRGANTTYTVKMRTPAILVGQLNPRTKRPYGNTIHEGLGTRDWREAAVKRDMFIAGIRREEAKARAALDGTVADALAWAEKRRLYELTAEPVETVDPRSQRRVLEPDTLAIDLIKERAEKSCDRKGPKVAERWYDIASGTAVPFATAAEQYLAASQRLSLSTRNNTKTEIKRFLAFAGPEVTLQEVDRAMVYRYLNLHLPNQRSPKAPEGLKKPSIVKAQTLLSGIWQWARQSGVLDYDKPSPWTDQLLTVRDDGPQRPQENEAKIFSPEQWRKLMGAAPVGKPLGDALRIAIQTGCRLSEIVSLSADDVEADATGFFVRTGKTKNARRYVPLFGEAQAIVRRRAFTNGPLFGEIAIRESTGKRSGPITQEFTRLRRKVLGVATDGDLDFHATRHTWRTMARRTAVPDRTVQELGGWAGQSTTDRPYDHGLSREAYRNAAWQVHQQLVAVGYLDEA
jgi:integrase